MTKRQPLVISEYNKEGVKISSLILETFSEPPTKISVKTMSGIGNLKSFFFPCLWNSYILIYLSIPLRRNMKPEMKRERDRERVWNKVCRNNSILTVRHWTSIHTTCHTNQNHIRDFGSGVNSTICRGSGGFQRRTGTHDGERGRGRWMGTGPIGDQTKASDMHSNIKDLITYLPQYTTHKKQTESNSHS